MPNILKGLSEQITLIIIDKNYINQYYICHRNEQSIHQASETDISHTKMFPVVML